MPDDTQIMTNAPQPPRQRLWRGDLLAVSFTIHLLALALPLALLQVYDRILPAQSFGTAGMLVFFTALAILLEAALRYGRQALFAALGRRFEAGALQAGFRQLQSADVAALERLGPAGITDAFRAISQVRDFWSGQAGAALYELPFVLLYLLLIAYIGGSLALIPLALFVLAVLLAGLLTPAIARLAARHDEAERQRNRFAWTIFAALDYLKAIGAEASVSQLWQRQNLETTDVSARLEARMGWLRENASTFGQLSTALIVACGAIEVMQGQLSTGALAACSMLAGRSIGPAMGSLAYWTQRTRMQEAEARVDALLKLPAAQASTQGSARITDAVLQIDAPDWLEAPQVFRPGEIVLLECDDNARASHLLAVIAGQTRDPSIRLSLDAQSAEVFAPEHWRASVLLVNRRLALVPGSILQNLTLFDPRLNGDVDALNQSLGLSELLARLRNGIHTEIGTAAMEQLDEGLSQRVAIIRALLRKPRILLLDHAASGLDLDGLKRLAVVLQDCAPRTLILMASSKPQLKAISTRSLKLKEGAPA